MRFGRCLVGTVAGLVWTAAAVAAPKPGRYDGELCVAVGAGRQGCGQAALQLGRDGLVSARVDDVVYRLQIRRDEVAVLLTQGAGQLDQFVADYRWDENTLRFTDLAKSARYELRFGRRH